MLEQRSLLSGNGLRGAHHTQNAPLDQSGDPTIIDFAGYQWNSNYNWSKDSGPYINDQLWSPENAVVQSDGLHLKLANAMIDGRSQFASADVALVGKANGHPFHPEYGTYLVSAKTTNGQSFSQFTNNSLAIFGAFTYENLHGVGQTSQGSNKITGLPASLIVTLKQQPGKVYVTANDYTGAPVFPVYPDTTFIKSIEGDTVVLTRAATNQAVSGSHTIYFTDNSIPNRKRELDAIEVSKFGNSGNPNNAQFAVQPTSPSDGGSYANVKGFTLSDSGQITIVMHWNGPKQPVEFSVYYGSYNLSDLPKTADVNYTTSANQEKYIPNTSEQTFHMNLWQASWQFNQNGNPCQASPAEIVVTNFQYDPQGAALRRRM